MGAGLPLCSVVEYNGEWQKAGGAGYVALFCGTSGAILGTSSVCRAAGAFCLIFSMNFFRAVGVAAAPHISMRLVHYTLILLYLSFCFLFACESSNLDT